MGTLRKNNYQRHADPTKPTNVNLQELVVAALTCPGFSEGMKTSIVFALSDGGYGQLSTARGLNLRFGGNHKYAAGWPFHVLVMKPGASNEIVEVSLVVVQHLRPH